MKHLFSISTFCLAVLFCVSAIPSNAATIDIEFSGASTGTTDVSLGPGAITFPSTSDPVLGIVGVYNVSAVISGVPTVADNGTFSINLGETYCFTSAECSSIHTFPTPNTNTLYVTGSLFGVTSTGFSDALVAITFSSQLTGALNASGTNFALNFPTGLVTGITVNPNLLMNLGLTSPYPTFSLAALTNVESGLNGSYTQAISNSLEITTATSATPEPGTWVMMTLGISLIVFAVRKRSALVRQ